MSVSVRREQGRREKDDGTSIAGMVRRKQIANRKKERTGQRQVINGKKNRGEITRGTRSRRVT